MGNVQLNEKDHIVHFGYSLDATEGLIEELYADHHEKRNFVVCSTIDQAQTISLEDNNRTKLASGRSLSSKDLMLRACIANASVIIVNPHNDGECLAICLAARNINPKAHIVVALENIDDMKEKIQLIDDEITCVPAGMTNMVVQEVQDPGIVEIYEDLMSNKVAETGFKFKLPKEFTETVLSKIALPAKAQFNATIIGISKGSDRNSGLIKNPDWEKTTVTGETHLYYLAKKRLDSGEWKSVFSKI